MKPWILSNGSCVFKMYFWQWKYDSRGSPAGTSALEIAFLTTSNSKLAWAFLCVSGRTDSSMVQDGKGMRRAQGSVLWQIPLVYVASRGRGNILCGAERDGKLGLTFSDPLREGQGGPLRCSWDLQCREAEGWPCSLVAAGRGFLGLCNGCSQLGQ